MGKRTLSGSEILAHSKNRHEQKHLREKLEQLSQSEFQIKDQNRVETQKWRQFLKDNVRNSGWSPMAMRPEVSDDYFLDASYGGSEIPTSARVRSRDPQYAQKFQKPWAYTFCSNSHNKVYKELAQAGENSRKILTSPPRAVAPPPDNNVTYPRLAQHVTAVTGLERAKSAWGAAERLLPSRQGKTPPTSPGYVNEAEFVEYTALNIDGKECRFERQVSKLKLVERARSAWTLKTRNSSTNAADETIERPVTVADTRGDGIPKLARSATQLSGLYKAKDAWLCSICGGDKNPGEMEQQFSRTALAYKGLQRAKSTFDSFRSSHKTPAPETDNEPVEDNSQGSARRCRCSCKHKTHLHGLPEQSPRNKQGGSQSNKKSTNSKKGTQRQHVTVTQTRSLDSALKNSSKNQSSKAPLSAKLSSVPDSRKLTKKSPTFTELSEKTPSTSGKVTPLKSNPKDSDDDKIIQKVEDTNVALCDTSEAESTQKKAPSDHGGKGKIQNALSDKSDSFPETLANLGHKDKNSTTTADNHTSSARLSKKESNNALASPQKADGNTSRNSPKSPVVQSKSDEVENAKTLSVFADSDTNSIPNSEVIADRYSQNAKTIRRWPTDGKINGSQNITLHSEDGEDVSPADDLRPLKNFENGPASPESNKMTKEPSVIGSEKQPTPAQEGATNSKPKRRFSELAAQRTQSFISEKGGSGKTFASRVKNNNKWTDVKFVANVERRVSAASTSLKNLIKPSHLRQKKQGRRMEDNVFYKIARVMLQKQRELRAEKAAAAAAEAEKLKLLDSARISTPRRSLSTGDRPAGLMYQIASRFVQRSSSVEQSNDNVFIETIPEHDDDNDSKGNNSEDNRMTDSNRKVSTVSNLDDTNAEITKPPSDADKDKSDDNKNNVGGSNDGNNDSNNNSNDNKSFNRQRKMGISKMPTEMKMANNNNENQTKQNSSCNTQNTPTSTVSTATTTTTTVTNKNNNNNNNSNNNNNNNNKTENNNNTTTTTASSATDDDDTPSPVNIPGVNMATGVLDYDSRGLLSYTSSNKVVEYKGIRLKNYVSPQQRYKTAARDSKKKGLSVRWHASEGAMVTTYQCEEKSKLVDMAFPKQCRQKLLAKMVEDNHTEPISNAAQIADAALRKRIEQFLLSVEPYCKPQKLLFDENF